MQIIRKNGVFLTCIIVILTLTLHVSEGNKLYVFCKDIVIYSLMWKYKDITTM